MGLLAVDGLSRAFGGLKAVEELAFALDTGTILGIIGPNGAGKTTLFNLLTGFIKADRGSVRLRGTEVLGLRPYQLVAQGIARSFQLVTPFAGMTALETVLLPAWGERRRRHRMSGGDRREQAREGLARLGLAEKADIRTDDLNQGELRLLDIARALATEPELLFLDEPFSGLGHEQIATLSALIDELRRGGLTIVIIEHRLSELMRLVDRVLVMNFGKKLADGKPADIVRAPEVIAAYLGSRGEELGAPRR